MSELKPCPFCGLDIYSEFYSERDKAEFDGHCTNKNCFLYGREFLFINPEKWNHRPIEDALEKENAELRNVIIGMLPMWINAMGYCEHGKQAQLLAMRNYYNGRDNPLTNDQIHLMFSVIPEKGK